MILQQATMKLSKIDGGVVSRISKLVLLWKEIGLCVHKEIYGKDMEYYVISHFNSGKSVLKCIKTRQKAEECMQKLSEVLEDWRFTLEDFDNAPSDAKAVIKIAVDILQLEVIQKEEA